VRPFSKRLQLDAPLVWATVALACAIALHATHLPVWVMAVFAVLVAWRATLGLRGARLPTGWLRALVVAVVLLGVLLTFRTLNGLNAGTAMLTLMAGVKLLETRTPRDHVVLLLITYIMVLAAFLYGQYLPLLPLYVAIVWLTTTALLRVTQSPATQTPRESVRLAGRMLLQATPLMVLLFLLFPRVAGPFWALPEGGGAVTGLSESMSPGDITELSLQSTVAFRVRFDGPVPPPAQRYWRGPVLHDFDGYTWRRLRAVTHPRIAPVFSGPQFTYTLMLEPSGQNWIFGLDLPQSWQGRRISQTFDYQLLYRDPIDHATTVTVSSATAYRFDEALSVSLRRRDTRLDETGSNPRSRRFATQLRASVGSDADYVAAILQMFREQEFVYSLSPPGLRRDSVDEFLFETRNGFCGHYASAFATLMRAAGIPARVVTGYQGGELNRYAGYYIVRQSDAHAWSEIWLDGRGWVRVDPTAAVAPERIESGLAEALGEDASVADRFVRFTPLLADLRFAWDAVHTMWRERIVDFNAASQRLMLGSLGIEDADWEALAVLLATGLALFAFVIAMQLARAMRGRPDDPALATYRRFCRKLERHGIARREHEGPLDFARRVARERPELSSVTSAITQIYLDLRYGSAPEPGGLDVLKRSVRSFS